MSNEWAAMIQHRRIIGPPLRRCTRCDVVAYCSHSHQFSHWSDHKEECGRDGEKITFYSYAHCNNEDCECKMAKEEHQPGDFSQSRDMELIKGLDAPAVFSDFREEAAHLAARCLSNVFNCAVTLPIQLNPFRQPLAVEDSALRLPCYSNCYIFGI
ncbi:hypothetical protein AKJ16_DCAP21835 [Drosera capensis]